MILKPHLRLQNLIEFFQTSAMYETLSLSRIEQIGTFNSCFNLLVSGLEKKPYDVLDYRKLEFKGDYEDFKVQLTELDVRIRA